MAGMIYGGQLTNGRANRTPDELFVKSEAWLNVGFVAKDPETGELVFIGLPRGIPLDSVQERSVDTGSKKARQIRAASNALLESLREQLEEMSWGESRVLDLQVEIRKVNKAEEQTEGGEETNPFLIRHQSAKSKKRSS